MLSPNQRIDNPKVAIIGRPNVGKSTLFNIMTDSRKSLVKDQPGVTRDIMIEPITIWGKSFDLMDTGGITESADLVSRLIREQVKDFLQTVDLIVAVMDGRSGMLPEDRDIIRLAKQTGKDFLLVINKVDRVHEEEIAKSDFYEFGVDIVSASFEQRRGVSDVLEWITNRLPESQNIEREALTLTLVGKPNVGKSSICNALLGSSRMLVSEIAGTTVDAVDTPFEWNGESYVLVDTAGLRRSSKREEDLEIISAFKSQEAIRKSNLILLIVDGNMGPTEQDAKIMQSILEDHKAVILVANKTDTASKEIPEFRKKFREQVEKNFHFFPDVHVVFTSAKTGFGLDDLFQKIEEVKKQINLRITTSDLNDFFFDTIRKAPSPVYATTNVKFYYLTQTYQKPPAFIAFANHPDGVTNAYRRFLVKSMKERFNLMGMTVRIFCMKSRRDSSKVD
ncbi:MAG: ribosome biogenesis GTPase Der [Bdellovibrionota bacterium]